MTTRLSFVPLLLGAAGALQESPSQTWVSRSERPYGSSITLADAGLHGRPVYLGADLFTWDGSRWLPATGLPANANSLETPAGDPLREELVLVAAVSPSVRHTFTFDGRSWTDHGPTPGGHLRSLHFDPNLDTVVAFTDDTANQRTQDWSWDGTRWQALAPNRRPYGVTGEVVTDSARDRVLVIAGVSGSPAQTETWAWDGTSWSRVATTGSLPGRAGAALGHDPGRGRIVRFGGQDPTGTRLFNDTWEWDGSRWTEVFPPAAPPRSAGSRFGFDPVTGSLVLFGLESEIGADWTWDGRTWRRLASAPGPAIAAHAGDTGRGLLVRYQVHGWGRLPSTLEWDGRTWTELRVPSPSARSTELSWDPATGSVLMFGGYSLLDGSALGEAWHWNGSTWQRSSAATLPGPRFDHAMAPDPGRSGVVLFGGLDDNLSALAETWHWNGSTWTDLTTFLPIAPPGGPSSFEAGVTAGNLRLVSGGELWQWNGRWTQLSPTVPVTNPDGAFGRDPATGASVLTGRDPNGRFASFAWNNGSWSQVGSPREDFDEAEHDPLRGNLLAFGPSGMAAYTGQPAATIGYGSGCGRPSPAALVEGLPRPGESSFRIAAHGAPTTNVAFLAGLAPTSLPIGNGCTLLVAAPVALGATTTNRFGVGSLPMPIPMDPALRGASLFLQVAEVRPRAPLGWVASGGLEIRIGD